MQLIKLSRYVFHCSYTLNFNLSNSVNGELGVWSSWSSCSVTCGGGTHDRNRQCNNPPAQNGGLDCTGFGYECTLFIAMITLIRQCRNIFINVTMLFNKYFSCVGGTQSSTRQCYNPPALFGGQQCAGVDTRTQNCNTHNCPSKFKMVKFLHLKYYFF